ncbi:MAG: hypothetical protein AB7K86_08545 [Rhodospirillales bacterium]
MTFTYQPAMTDGCAIQSVPGSPAVLVRGRLSTIYLDSEVGVAMIHPASARPDQAVFVPTADVVRVDVDVRPAIDVLLEQAAGAEPEVAARLVSAANLLGRVAG